MSVRERPPWPGDAVNNTSGWIGASTPYRQKNGIEKVCRLCAKPGLPDNRFSWHPRCGNVASASTFLYYGLMWCVRRQHGRCPTCDVMVARWVAETGYTSAHWQINSALELDHVVPLWKVALMPRARQTVRWWLPGNLQALCQSCHRAKTKAEARERARAKSAQRSLDLGSG